jgi:NhaA family Na+:H+ antiporter
MAIFFLMVGLEIKRELTMGALASWSERILPGAAAMGGMVIPALIFVALNWGQNDVLSGWAIPSATDIAFALGVLAILGSRVPAAIRVLVVSIAIIDDLLAILVIALFYSEGLELMWLALGALTVLALVMLNRRSVMQLTPYLMLGVVLWIAVYNSGLHATLAGVIVALTIPARGASDTSPAPLTILEHRILYWVNFGIVPLFGFANAGVSLSGLGKEAFIGTLPLGIAAGLFIGKQIGVFGTIWLLVRVGVARMPARTTWSQIHAMAMLCGIGFTMSLFIGGLAYATSPEHMDATKIGVIGGSLISALLGAWLMRRAPSIVDDDHATTT